MTWPFEPLRPGAYRVLYADPPWAWRAWGKRGEAKSASQHYDLMTLGELKALPVEELAAPDAVLFLWVVQPMLPQAFELLSCWGFTFKTVAFCWVKMPASWDPDQFSFVPQKARQGLGYHTQSGMEQCWLATRGRGYQRRAMNVQQVLHAPVREHSRKPEEIRRRIERLTGDYARVELFARGYVPDWDVWGREARNGY